MEVRAGRELPFPTPPPAQAQAHLLQDSLLGEVELLEAVILVITGGVQVVSVHLGTG